MLLDKLGDDDESGGIGLKICVPLLLYLFTNKKARIGVQKKCENLCLNFDDKTNKIYESSDIKEMNEEEIIYLRKILKYAQEKIKLNQLYPINSWILDLKKSEYSKGTTNFEEFKEFYFKSDVLKGKNLEQRKKIALNDLLYETDLDNFKQEDFEKKLIYSIAPNGRENIFNNYFKMISSNVSHVKKNGLIFFLGAYILNKRLKVFNEVNIETYFK